jgi:hypothetical protein
MYRGDHKCRTFSWLVDLVALIPSISAYPKIPPASVVERQELVSVEQISSLWWLDECPSHFKWVTSERQSMQSIDSILSLGSQSELHKSVTYDSS